MYRLSKEPSSSCKTLSFGLCMTLFRRGKNNRVQIYAGAGVLLFKLDYYNDVLQFHLQRGDRDNVNILSL